MSNKMTRHHKKPSSIGGDNSERNISHIKDNHHKAWHILFKNYSAPYIIELINKYYIDPDFYIECIPKDQVGGHYE